MVTGSTGNQDSTELFDPSSGTWSTGMPMTESRFLHTATTLMDGRVLLTGGQGVERLSNTIEIYDP